MFFQNNRREGRSLRLRCNYGTTADIIARLEDGVGVPRNDAAHIIVIDHAAAISALAFLDVTHRSDKPHAIFWHGDYLCAMCAAGVVR